MAVPTSQARLNRWIALLGVTAVTVYLSWKVLEPFVEVLILGIALTVIFQPLHKRFVRWTKGNRIAAALSTLSVLMVLIVPVTFVSITLIKEVGPAIEQLKNGYNSIIEAIDKKLPGKKESDKDDAVAKEGEPAVAGQATASAPTPATAFAPTPATAPAPAADVPAIKENGKEPAKADPPPDEGRLTRLIKELGLGDILTPQKIEEWKSKAPGFVADNAFRVGYGVLGFVLGFVFLIFVLFFLFRDGSKLGARLIDMLPMPRDQALALVQRTEEVLGGCVYGVLMVAAVQGTLGGITFWALGLGSPVTWGLVMTLLCTLPIVGAWVVWVPAAISLAVSGHYEKAIILAVIGQFVISTIDGFLRPIFVGQRAKMHELVIFFSVLGGLKYFGILGILLGPIVMSLAWSLTSVLWQANGGKNTEPVSPAI